MLVKHTYRFINKKEVSKYAYLFFIVFYLISISKSLSQSTPIDDDIRKNYHNILKLKIEKSKTNSQISESEREIYALNLADILELLLSEDVDLYNKKKSLEKTRLSAIAKLKDSNPYKKFCEAEIKLQWAFVKLKFGDELSAVWNINQAYKAIYLNAEKFPNFLPNKKTLGVFNVILGAVPQKYQWVLNFFSMQGSTEKGVSDLTLLSETNNFFSLESTILLRLTEAYLLDNAPNAIREFEELATRHPDNKLIRYLLTLTLLKNNQAENALQVLAETDDLDDQYIPLILSDYLKGEIMLQKGLYDDASSYYATFLLKYKGKNFIKDAYYKLFIANYLLGESEQATYYYNKAKTTGSTTAEADKYADKQLSSNEYPNKEILKIRLATDGGFYERADTLIKKYKIEDFPKSKDQVEFIYRKARLYDKQGLLEKAITLYHITIEKAGNNEWYFAPNASLQLGYLYSQKKQKEKAAYFFNKATSYKNYEYKNSIDNKAEAGLQKLK